MQKSKLHSSNAEIMGVTYLGIVVNVFLSIFKVVVGITSGSIALIADGIHSVSDMATDVAVLLGAHFGAKEADPEHPFGHGRLETFAAGVVAIVLISLGGAMIYRASVDIVRMNLGTMQPAVLTSMAFVVVVLSIVLKEALYQITRKVAVRSHSSALYANAWHHRSDAASSVAVLVGFIAMKFGYDHGDQIAAIAVGLMIIFVGVKVVGGCLHEFAERAVDDETVKQIEKVISSETRIRNWHKLRTRSAGREIFLDLHILVDPELNVTEAHQISESLEQSMHAEIPRPVNIMIHIEPDTPQQRR